jgi:hypothetical protein
MILIGIINVPSAVWFILSYFMWNKRSPIQGLPICCLWNKKNQEYILGKTYVYLCSTFFFLNFYLLVSCLYILQANKNLKKKSTVVLAIYTVYSVLHSFWVQRGGSTIFSCTKKNWEKYILGVQNFPSGRIVRGKQRLDVCCRRWPKYPIFCVCVMTVVEY